MRHVAVVGHALLENSTVKLRREDVTQLFALPEDRHPGFEIGRLDIRGESPLKTRTQSFFQSDHRLRRSVDLPVPETQEEDRWADSIT